MNSEELELSLRTEFESYLKGFLAELRQEVSEFQKNFETELAKHKTQTDEAVGKLLSRFEAGVQFDNAFNESVVEHLRLARDEGATITAVAIGEAEKLKEDSAPAPEFDKLRDAINEISSKTSQSEILKSLVDHASNFAPRGVFFIVKNEHFNGWRAFGDEANADETKVRDLQVPMSADTLLADAVNRLGTSAGTHGVHAGDDQFLNALAFGKPDRMYAVPLVARGRGVAVLYADYGTEGVALQVEALETLVRVAGLTVELAAAAVQPSPAPTPVTRHSTPPAPERAAGPFDEKPEPAVEQPESADETPAAEIDSAADEYQGVYEFDRTRDDSPAHREAGADETAGLHEIQPSYGATETGFATVDEPPPAVAEMVEERSFETVDEVPVQSWRQEPVQVERLGDPVVHEVEEVEEVTYFEAVEEVETVSEPAFAQAEIVEEYVPVDAVEEFPDVIDEPANGSAAGYAPLQAEAVAGSPSPAAFEPAAEVASAQASRTKYRDRNVDLPIEVPEEERRLHNDARRFARLLVSEIKLYNEQKVNEGRETGDLYDRLREAIDRSRDMYDKRVQHAVAEKFDYFHYELVNSLADGQDVKLGSSYPGSKVPA